MNQTENLRERLLKNSKWNGDCLECTYKAKSQSGYCLMKINRSTAGAHRISWIVNFGQIPNGLWVLHRCDNPICINPDHLFLGTPLDNSLDMRKKGRENYQGSRKYDKKVESRIVQMRISGFKLNEISKELNLNMSTVASILRRNSETNGTKKIVGVPKYPSELRRLAHEMRKKGVKCKDIQKELCIPKKTLTAILHNRTKNIDLIIL